MEISNPTAKSVDGGRRDGGRGVEVVDVSTLVIVVEVVVLRDVQEVVSRKENVKNNL